MEKKSLDLLLIVKYVEEGEQLIYKVMIVVFYLFRIKLFLENLYLYMLMNLEKVLVKLILEKSLS
jgi:hypothetical protein